MSEDNAEAKKELELNLTDEQRVQLDLDDSNVEALVNVFKMIDSDGNGVLSSQELSTAMRALGLNPTDGEISDLIKEIDANQNGSIDFPEFAAMMAPKLKEYDPEKELQEAFRVFDKNGDGFISFEELKQVVTSIGEAMTVEEVEQMMEDADLNHDGKLDYSEFLRIWTDTSTETKTDQTGEEQKQKNTSADTSTETKTDQTGEEQKQKNTSASAEQNG